jgi:hypothetical protein
LARPVGVAEKSAVRELDDQEPDAWWLPWVLRARLPVVLGAKALCRQDEVRSAERSFAAEESMAEAAHSAQPVSQPWSALEPEAPRAVAALQQVRW